MRVRLVTRFPNDGNRLLPIIGTNDVLGEYVEAVAHEVINDQQDLSLPFRSMEHRNDDQNSLPAAYLF